MFQNYLITAWRNIVKNGMFSAINILGLAIGLMSCILILLFVRAESGYDKWIPQHDRVVRLHTAYDMSGRPPFHTVRSAGRIKDALANFASAQIEDGIRIIQTGVSFRQDDTAIAETATLADGSFFNVFDFPLLHGSKDTAYDSPGDLLITEEVAQRYFGRTDVIGEVMTVCCVGPNPTDFRVTGILKNLPDESHMDLDFLVYMDPVWFANAPNMLETWTSVNVFTYFKMKQGVSISELQERVYYWIDNESPFLEMYKQNIGELPEGMKVSDELKLKLMSIADIHLKARQHAGNGGDMRPLGDINMIYTFSVVAVIILIIACINFINLATARASQRAKEVAVRKVLGASRMQVAVQFLGEAIALVFIALIIAIAAVELVLPIYNSILGRNLSFDVLEEIGFIFMLFGSATLVGLIAGIYPALFLSNYLPGNILRGTKGAETSSTNKMRSLLVVFQFTASVILVVCTAVVYIQTLYANSMDVGYQSENKLVLNIRQARGTVDTIKQEIEKLPGVTSVVLSSEAPSQDNENNTSFRLVGGQVSSQAPDGELLNYHNMDFGFFEAYGVQPIAGRLFSEDFGAEVVEPIDENDIGQASAILNETAIMKLGFSNPQEAIGKTLNAELFRAGNYNLTIIGVIPDIYFRSIRFGVRPSIYMLNRNLFRVATISYNTNDIPQLMQDIEQIWNNNVTMQPMNLQFLSEMMAAQYAEEQTQANLFAAFSILATFVACLGLFGLAAFTAERRTREIGIRKVMGARIRDIVKLLLWQFSKPVVLANLIAWPVSIYLMLNWLQTFQYRIDTLWLLPICLVAGSLSLIVAWSTVAGNAWAVARENPVKALRQE